MSAKFSLIFVSLLTADFVKNGRTYAGIHFIFLKSILKQIILKQISTSVKRSEMQVPINAKFSTFLKLNCSIFRLELEKGFQIHLFAKHLKLTLVFI